MSQSYEGDPVDVNKESDVNQAETRLCLSSNFDIVF